MAVKEDEELLSGGCPRWGGFHARPVGGGGRWRSYASACDRLLQQAYAAGCPSMRLCVKGHMYKFDFEKMVQRNLNTLEDFEMRPPTEMTRPSSKGALSAFKAAVRWRRPVMVVRVPANGPGTVIRVPHPKKLGKAWHVSVPAEAEVGQPLFVPVPRTGVSKSKFAAAGLAGGATAGAAVVMAAEGSGTLAAGGAAAAGGVASLAAAGAPVLAAGVVLAGCAAAAGATVHYASRNPAKAAAVGALTIGALAFVDHAGDVGGVEAVRDVAGGAGDLVDHVVDGVSRATGDPAAAEVAGGDVVEAAGEAAGDGMPGAGEEVLAASGFPEHAGCAAEELLEDVDWLASEGDDCLDSAVDMLSELF